MIQSIFMFVENRDNHFNMNVMINQLYLRGILNNLVKTNDGRFGVDWRFLRFCIFHSPKKHTFNWNVIHLSMRVTGDRKICENESMVIDSHQPALRICKLCNIDCRINSDESCKYKWPQAMNTLDLCALYASKWINKHTERHALRIVYLSISNGAYQLIFEFDGISERIHESGNIVSALQHSHIMFGASRYCIRNQNAVNMPIDW